MSLPTNRELELPLLREIVTQGGEARPTDIYPQMRKYFPSITDSDLQSILSSTGGNLWTNRIQWARQHLVSKGDLFREPRGVWRITPQGKARVEGKPFQDQGSSPKKQVIKPPIQPTAKPPVVVVTDAVEQLCATLLKAQQQSSTPHNFEAALAAAFRFLGFDVQELGKAGETDILLNTHIGPDSYSVVIDAKATHGSKVADNQINWLAIHQHQQQTHADHAAVLGIDFAGGNLLKWASQYQVALLRTGDLIDLIRMHRRAPFTLVELRSLFAAPGPAQQPLQDLKLIYSGAIRHWHLLLEVVEQIHSYNRFNKTGLAATPEGIQLMLYSKIASQSGGTLDASRIPTTEDVKEAMGFLASRAIGVLRETPAGSGKYHLTTHYDGVVRRIGALAQQLDEMDLKAAATVVADKPKNS